MDEVRYTDELAAVLAELAPPCLHVLAGGVNSDRSDCVRGAGGVGMNVHLWLCVRRVTDLVRPCLCGGVLLQPLPVPFPNASLPPPPTRGSGLAMPPISFPDSEQFSFESRALHPVRTGVARGRFPFK